MQIVSSGIQIDYCPVDIDKFVSFAWQLILATLNYKDAVLSITLRSCYNSLPVPLLISGLNKIFDTCSFYICESQDFIHFYCILFN